MNKNLIQDIGDDEIRIISHPNSNVSAKGSQMHVRSWDGTKGRGVKIGSTSNARTYKIIIGVMVVLILGLLLFIFLHKPQEETDFVDTEAIIEACEETDMVKDKAGVPSYVEFSQVETELSPLIILTPKNATPRLEVGQTQINEPGIKMIFQAADVRSDNQQINGAFVQKGELLSRGQSKSGFCAIIDGEINLGVAEATPLLEKAIETDGYFFRQYPLVAGGQIVENKLMTHSFRKALAQIGEKTVVVISQKRLTLHEFSEALIQAGVTQAIYLIGGNGYGFAVDATGKKVTFGEVLEEDSGINLDNINYIAWY